MGLPGTWLMIVTAGALEWMTPGREVFHPLTFGAAVALASVGELIEFLASSHGARRAGASRRSAVGALVGGVAGAILGTIFIPLPIVGSLTGGAAGAFIGSAALERVDGSEVRVALRVGRGAAVGHLGGMLGKLAMAVAVWLLFAVAVFVP